MIWRANLKNMSKRLLSTSSRWFPRRRMKVIYKWYLAGSTKARSYWEKDLHLCMLALDGKSWHSAKSVCWYKTYTIGFPSIREQFVESIPICLLEVSYEQWEDEGDIRLLAFGELSYEWIVTFLGNAHRPLLAMRKPLTTVLLRR